MKVYAYVLFRPVWMLVTFEITEAISKNYKKKCTLTATWSPKIVLLLPLMTIAITSTITIAMTITTTITLAVTITITFTIAITTTIKITISCSRLIVIVVGIAK